MTLSRTTIYGRTQQNEIATKLHSKSRIRLARAEGDLKEVEERSASGKTAMEKQISLQETLTTLQKDKADEAMKKIASLQVTCLCVAL